MKNCVYRFIDENENIIYVGKAKELRNRLSNHKHLTDECYKEMRYVDYTCFENEYEMDFAERYYIQKYTPKFNTILKDRPISFTCTELDNAIFNLYETNDFIVEKNKLQLENFINENVVFGNINFKLDIDMFDLMGFYFLISTSEYKEIKKSDTSSKDILKRLESYERIKTNVYLQIQNIADRFKEKYNFLDFTICPVGEAAILKKVINLRERKIRFILAVRESYKDTLNTYNLIIECK